MSSTIGDYLFWKLATLGARQVLSCTPCTLFIGSIQRNRLTHVDTTRYEAITFSTEVGVFAVAPNVADLTACFAAGRYYFPGRPIVFIQELHAAEFRSAADLTAGMGFAAATIVDATSTAVSQIDGILNTMFYERKAVYIGIVPSVAGVVIAVSPGDTAGSSGSTGYSVSAGQVHAASAAVAMAFIR